MKRVLLTFASLMVISPAAWAGPCATATLDTYAASGFACSIGDLEFSNFKWDTNLFANDQYGGGNQPSDITVTPQNGAGGIGFQFSNLNLSFFGGLSNRTSGADFDVTALSGLITGASLALGGHTFTGPDGAAYGFFGDTFDTYFTVTVADPALSGFYNTPYRLSDSASFAGITSMSLYSGVSAVVDGFGGGDATVGDYTVLLSMGSATTAVPEPASMALLGSGLLGLGLIRRRRKVR